MDENGRPTCSTCRFYHELSKSCRRNPPFPMLLGIKQNVLNPQMGEPQFISVFPMMEKHGWCGEHKLKIEKMQ